MGRLTGERRPALLPLPPRCRRQRIHPRERRDLHLLRARYGLDLHRDLLHRAGRQRALLPLVHRRRQRRRTIRGRLHRLIRTRRRQHGDPGARHPPRPGLPFWQDPHWLVHCNDAAAFIGEVGYTELAAHPEALDQLRTDLRIDGFRDAAQLERFVTHLGQSASAMLFRCTVCGTHLAYADAS